MRNYIFSINVLEGLKGDWSSFRPWFRFSILNFGVLWLGITKRSYPCYIWRWFLFWIQFYLFFSCLEWSYPSESPCGRLRFLWWSNRLAYCRCPASSWSLLVVWRYLWAFLVRLANFLHLQRAVAECLGWLRSILWTTDMICCSCRNWQLIQTKHLQTLIRSRLNWWSSEWFLLTFEDDL